jgi:hypothetical protein
MYLTELIKFLEKCDPALVVPVGFTHAHSYRGYYEDLAFEPAKNVTVGAMLACAKDALGKTFAGYKGGEFEMDEYTDIWLAYYGECGEGIGPILLSYMIGEPRAALEEAGDGDG